MKKVAVLTGAGISAESGLQTFRNAGGLWEGHDVMEVASLSGWERHPEKVLTFYNERRKKASFAKPNAAHQALRELEKFFDIHIITQNVDHLHEKAGSTRVMHLHGELSKARSTRHPHLVYDIGDKPLNIGDRCEKGAQLRPHIVWFGEQVPLMEDALREVQSADILLVVGTSLVVYPAAGLMDAFPKGRDVYVVNPELPSLPQDLLLHLLALPATQGVPKVAQLLMEKHVL